MDHLGALFQGLEDYIIQTRRWFHRHPELSLKEEETSAKIKDELGQMGIPFEELKPGHGVAATISGKGGKKRIAARADIDALPVVEDTGLEFASCNEGAMHACGHDGHIAMLLGAAKALNSIKDELDGTVVLVFQSAEEIGLGYREALDYLEAAGGVDQIIGLHIWSTIPAGEILLLPGTVFAGCKAFTGKIYGKGGHGARPDLVNDPIKAACDLVLKLASIPSNFYDVLDHSVVSVGKIESGSMGNTFPSYAEIRGTSRYYKKGGSDKICEKMERIAAGVAAVYDVDIQLEHDANSVVPVYNEPSLIPKARELALQVEGLALSAQTDPICASDNFCYLVERYSGFYGVLGAGSPTSYPQHHAKFDIKESELRKGAEFIGRYIADYLK